jgi:hypothetical protein
MTKRVNTTIGGKMKIQEAIKGGKMMKRNGWSDVTIPTDLDVAHSILMSDLVATDWVNVRLVAVKKTAKKLKKKSQK